MKPEIFSWTAFDPNRWDHYYHAGQQIRFYREMPCQLGGPGIYAPRKKWIDTLFRILGAR